MAGPSSCFSPILRPFVGTCEFRLCRHTDRLEKLFNLRLRVRDVKLEKEDGLYPAIDQVRRYQDRAAELRAMADICLIAENRTMLLGLADNFERFARDLRLGGA